MATQTAEKKPDTVSTNILETLSNIRKGDLLFDLSQKTEELVKAIRVTGQGGRITLVLDFKPMRQGDGSVILIDDDVRAKIPEPDKDSTIMYTTSKGTMQRNDPRQEVFQGDGFTK